MMQLPKGVTGFYAPGEAEPPTVDTKVFTAVCYAACRSIGAQVLAVEVHGIVRSYHRAEIRLTSGRARQIICNRHHLLLAIAQEAMEGEFYPQFVEEPALAAALRVSGEFEVLSTQILLGVPNRETTALLGRAELQQLNDWQPETIGQILFNCWD